MCISLQLLHSIENNHGVDFRRNVNQQTVLEAAPIGVPEMKLLSWEHENWLPDTTNDEAQASSMPISAFSAQLGT